MCFGEGKGFVRRLDFVIDCEHGDFAIGGALPGLEYTNVFGFVVAFGGVSYAVFPISRLNPGFDEEPAAGLEVTCNRLNRRCESVERFGVTKRAEKAGNCVVLARQVKITHVCHGEVAGWVFTLGNFDEVRLKVDAVDVVAVGFP